MYFLQSVVTNYFHALIFFFLLNVRLSLQMLITDKKYISLGFFFPATAGFILRWWCWFLLSLWKFWQWWIQINNCFYSSKPDLVWNALISTLLAGLSSQGRPLGRKLPTPAKLPHHISNYNSKSLSQILSANT